MSDDRVGVGADHAERFPWDLDDGWDERGDDRRARRVLLLAAAVIPWLVVVVLATRPTAVPAPSPGDPSPAAPSVAVPETPSPPPSPDDDGVDGTPSEAVRFGVRPTAGPGHAAATALLVVRDWLGGAAPPLRTGIPPRGGDGYVEHVAVEGVDLTLDPYALVTLSAVVLEADANVYRDARTVRVAVPVVLSEGAADPAGEPWLLPRRELGLATPDWRDVDDPDVSVAAGTALVETGYEEVEVTAVERAATGHLLRVTATAVAPGEHRASAHRVWLREQLGELVVAGALRASAAPPAVDRTPAEGTPP